MIEIRMGDGVADVPPPPRIWKTGEPCRITTGGRCVDGRVELASQNGVSLFITYEAMLNPEGGLGGYAGGMAIMWNGTEFQDLAGLGVVKLSEPEPEAS